MYVFTMLYARRKQFSLCYGEIPHVKQVVHLFETVHFTISLLFCYPYKMMKMTKAIYPVIRYCYTLFGHV